MMVGKNNPIKNNHLGRKKNSPIAIKKLRARFKRICHAFLKNNNPVANKNAVRINTLQFPETNFNASENEVSKAKLIRNIAIDPSNPQRIWIARNDKIY